MAKLEDYKTVVFESSSRKTPQFKSFARAFKARIKEQMESRGLKITTWSNGHFYCTAFIQNPETGKYVYISISDVRFFSNDWYNKILIRRAAHDKDYTGESNFYKSICTVADMARFLTRD